MSPQSRGVVVVFEFPFHSNLACGLSECRMISGSHPSCTDEIVICAFGHFTVYPAQTEQPLKRLKQKRVHFVVAER